VPIVVMLAMIDALTPFDASRWRKPKSPDEKFDSLVRQQRVIFGVLAAIAGGYIVATIASGLALLFN
jgi:hypothetical protein